MNRNKRQRISDEQVSLLLLSGGKGKRAALEYPKQFFAIAGHPMIAYSLIAARKVPDVDEIVVNAPEGTKSKPQKSLPPTFRAFPQRSCNPVKPGKNQSGCYVTRPATTP